MYHGRRGGVAVGVSAAFETERAHPTHNPSGISIGSAVFAEMAAKCPYTFGMGRPFPASELPLPMGDLDPHLIHGYLDPPESSTQMAS